VVAPLPEPTESSTTRQRVEVQHLAVDGCRSCHLQMDLIGFGLEHFDAAGRYRDKEGRFDIDDSGQLLNTSAGDITFKGAEELARRLASLPETSTCLAAFLASNAFGLDHHDTTCMVRSAAEELRAGTIGLVDYYVRMARAEHFRTRTP
jgi:translation elongation factor EF-1beta